MCPLCNIAVQTQALILPTAPAKPTSNNSFSWLSSNSSDRENGYYNTTIGVNTPNNTIYGAFLCRGDLTTEACQDCVFAAAIEVLQDCPIQKESVIWFDKCMVRYSDQSFFSISTEELAPSLFNTVNVSDKGHFIQLLGDTMNTVADKAAKGGADNKYATKEANFSSFETLYTLAQCTPGLSQLDCRKCLTRTIREIPLCCDGKQRGMVRVPSCNIRYELYQFYDQVIKSVPTPPPQEPPRPYPKEKSRISAGIIITIVASIVFFCWLPSLPYGSYLQGQEEKSTVQCQKKMFKFPQ